MQKGPPVAAIALVVLVAVISAVFVFGREEAPPRKPADGPGDGGAVSPERRTGLFASFLELSPRLRGLQTSGLDVEAAEARARRWVEGLLGPDQPWPRDVVHQALRDADWAVRWAGCLAIPRYGPAGPELAALLEPCLEDESPWVRRAAARGAAYFGKPFERLVPALRRLAERGDPGVRLVALRTLARRSALLLQLVPLFASALTDGDADVRGVGAYGIAQIELQERLTAAEVEALIGPLTKALSDEASDVRMYAAMALGRAGGAATPAIPALLALLADDFALVRTQAATALGSLGSAALPALADALTRDDGTRASLLLWALRLIGEPALPTIRGALAHPSGLVRVHAAMKIWELEREVEPVLRILQAALESTDPEVLLQAARGLGRIGEAARPAIAALARHESHPDAAVQAAVRGALALLDPDRAPPK